MHFKLDYKTVDYEVEMSFEIQCFELSWKLWFVMFLWVSGLETSFLNPMIIFLKIVNLELSLAFRIWTFLWIWIFGFRYDSITICNFNYLALWIPAPLVPPGHVPSRMPLVRLRYAPGFRFYNFQVPNLRISMHRVSNFQRVDARCSNFRISIDRVPIWWIIEFRSSILRSTFSFGGIVVNFLFGEHRCSSFQMQNLQYS